MKAISLKIRFSRKLILLIAGIVLVLSGTSAAFAVYTSKNKLLDREEQPAPSGIACTTVETLKMRRNGQRWIRKYVRTDMTTDGVQRVRTALRVAGLLVKAEKADLYQVVVLDQAGPAERSAWRGAAIGAEVLFTPDPSKVPGMSAPFVARYNDASANMVGLFHGREVELAMADIQSAITAMVDKTDCLDPVAAAAALEAGAKGSEAGSHGEAAPAEGHGEAVAAEHGSEVPAAEGEEAAAPAHGEETAPVAHEETKAGEQGFFGSIMSMVFGSKTEAAAEHDAVPPVSESESTPAAEHSAIVPADGQGESQAPAGHEEAAASAH